MSAANINIFSKRVSVFPEMAKARHTVQTLAEFLDGWKPYKQDIDRARALRASLEPLYNSGNMEAYNKALKQYDAIKAALPAAMPQGVCPTATKGGFESYTDILCLDIDREKPGKAPNGNENLDLDELKAFFSKLDFVAYCGLSLGGMGLFVLIPIATHERHADYWQSLYKLLKKYGITVDGATKNINRKRGISYDPGAYYNPCAKVFAMLPGEDRAEKRKRQTVALKYNGDPGEDTTRMYAAAEEIIRRHIDITESYDDWLKLGASIANTQGEGGRELYHSLSRINEGYDRAQTDRKFTSLVNDKNGRSRSCNFGTFFELCKRHGVKVPHPKTTQEPPKAQPRDTKRQTRERPAAKPGLSAAAREQLLQRAELITAHHFMLEEIEERNPGFKDFMQDLGAHYCGGGIIGGFDWHLNDEQYNFLIEKKQI